MIGAGLRVQHARNLLRRRAPSLRAEPPRRWVHEGDDVGVKYCSLSSGSTGAAKESESARQSDDGDRSIAIGRVKSNAAT